VDRGRDDQRHRQRPSCRRDRESDILFLDDLLPEITGREFVENHERKRKHDNANARKHQGGDEVPDIDELRKWLNPDFFLFLYL